MDISLDITERIYLDYNATAPLCKSFVDALSSNKVPFANPSSQHTSGKQVHRYIEEVKSYLLHYFNLSANKWDVLFHSGATEASNTFLSSKEDRLLYFNSDHACVTRLGNFESSISLNIAKDGSMNLDEVVASIKQHNCSWMHFTYVHNETGVRWDLELAKKIKERTSCKIYVDAVQSVGKVENFNKLIDDLDVYTFSGHKFGALKGVGFSFYKRDLSFSPLILGGGQQKQKRSGTLNTQGIASLKYALEAVELSEDIKLLKHQISNLLSSNVNINVIKSESYNTICFVHKTLKSDIMLIHFDLAGLDVSSGSACSAGSVTESAALRAMGYGELASHNIRISLGAPNIAQKDVLIEKIKLVLEKL
jgi:cysteine desulfurase